MYNKQLGRKLFVCIIITSFLSLTTPINADDRDKSSLSHYIMGLLSERWDEQDVAIEEYKLAEEFDYYSAQLHLKLGSAYLRNKDFPNSLYHLELAVKLDPQDIQARFVLAVLYTALGRQEEAASQYEQILKEASKLEPENIQLYHNLAEFYFRQNKLDQALMQYEYILSIEPNDKIAHFYLGNILHIQGKKDLAIKEFKKAIEIDSNYADALNTLGYIYAQEGINLNEAESLIEQALILDPDNAAYIDSLGWVYFKKGLINEALEKLEKAAEYLPDPEIYDHLGDVYYKLNIFDKAIENWQRALELNPLQKKIEEKLDNLKKIQKQ